MSTSLPTFQFGEVASASQLMAAFNVLWNQGENILNTLTGYRNMSLVDFQQQVEALNSRLQRANRISPPYTTVDFVTTDFLDIDQTQTSATVRADAQAVTLKERSTTTNAVIQNQTFATSDGTAEAISTDNSLYRVSTTDGSIPTGPNAGNFARVKSRRLHRWRGRGGPASRGVRRRAHRPRRRGPATPCERESGEYVRYRFSLRPA